MNRERPTHLFIQVAETLRGRIKHGLYGLGDLLPSARELEKEFKVSNITIRKALDRLSQEGLIVSRRGRGTQVARGREDLVPLQITGNFRDWADSVAGKKPRLEAVVLDVALVDGPPRTREVLSVRPGEKLWRMRRVRKVRGLPVSCYINYGLQEVCARISQEEVEKRSFVEVFEEVSGVRLARIEQRVEARVADMDTSALLGTDFGSPIFFVDNIYFSSRGVPVAVTHMYFRGDRYAYRTLIEL